MPRNFDQSVVRRPAKRRLLERSKPRPWEASSSTVCASNLMAIVPQHALFPSVSSQRRTRLTLEGLPESVAKSAVKPERRCHPPDCHSRSEKLSRRIQ